MIYTVPLAAGIVTGLIALGLWAYRKLPRAQAALFCVACFTLTVAIVPWLDALAGLSASPAGLTILTGAVILGAVCTWFEVVRKHKHHPVRTPVIAGTFGVALVLAYADGAALISNLGRSTRMTGTALSVAVDRIRDGKAARAVAPDHRMLILAIGIGIIVALVIIALKFESGKKRPGRPGAGTRRTSGRTLPQLTRGR